MRGIIFLLVVCFLKFIIKELSKPEVSKEDELYSLISSHTARRSFATNYYLQGFPRLDLMKITGHKTEKSFLKYIRVSKLDTAMRLSAHIKTRWNEKLNKIIQ
jgi:integrase